MVYLSDGKELVAFRIGSNITALPTAFAIGEGSGTALVSDTALESESDKQVFTTTNFGTPQKIVYQGDWNSIEMSGISLAEIGISTSATASTGSLFTRTSFEPLTFDGTNELQVEEVWEVF